MKLNLRDAKVNELRKNDLIPGVIYGKGIEPTSVQADYKEINKAFHNYGTSMTFEVSLGKEKHLVYIKDYQADYLHNYKMIHFDLVKVSADDTITANIPLNFLHRDLVGRAGEVLSVNLNEIEVEYQVGKGVAHIDVDLTPLQTENAIHVSDIVAPEGITILNDMNQIVANLTTVSAIEEEPAEGEETESVVVAEEEVETEE